MANLDNRNQVESSFIDRLLPIFADQRSAVEKVIDSLGNVSLIPPSTWMKNNQDLEEQLTIALLLIFGSSAIQHGLGREIATGRAEQYARERAKEVARQFAKNNRGRFSTLDDPTNLDAIQERLDSTFGPDRIERMVATETTAAATAGSEFAMMDLGKISESDIWWTEDDRRVCGICSPLHLTTRNKWQIEMPLGPPAHPNCRCWIEYLGTPTYPGVP